VFTIAWRDDLDGLSPVRPQPRQQHPQEAISGTETQAPRRLALEYGELMPEGENLHLELETRPNGGPEGGEQREEQRSHTGRERYQPPAPICNGDKRFRIVGRDRSLW